MVGDAEEEIQRGAETAWVGSGHGELTSTILPVYSQPVAALNPSRRLAMDWLWSGWNDVGIAISRAAIIFTAVIVLTRVTGLRSYAKMSSSDFIATLAIGSATASAVMSLEMSIAAALCAVAGLYGLQWLSAYVERFDGAEQLLNNRPMLLMVGDELLYDNIARVTCTPGDVYAKLREANVMHPDEVLAVVFETTGDISVLHSREETFRFDPRIFSGIEDHERLLAKGGRFQPDRSLDSRERSSD